jgi:hypothetical protein
LASEVSLLLGLEKKTSSEWSALGLMNWISGDLQLQRRLLNGGVDFFIEYTISFGTD